MVSFVYIWGEGEDCVCWLGIEYDGYEVYEELEYCVFVFSDEGIIVLEVKSEVEEYEGLWCCVKKIWFENGF